MATLEQQRAQQAWEMVKKAREESAQARWTFKEYVNTCKGLPALIMTSGLMQTMAFLEQKKGRHAFIGKQIRDWLHERYQSPKEFEPFMQAMFLVDSAAYQKVNSEVFALLKWLRQLSAAMEKTGG